MNQALPMVCLTRHAVAAKTGMVAMVDRETT